MRKPLTAALLLGGHLLLTFFPVAASAAPASPTSPAYDGHYRCMYRCAERGYGSHDGYRRDGYRRDGDRYHDGYGYRDGGGYRYDHYRDGYHRGCWYHDDWGWHRCGYYHRW
jgi:hypothetical protein